MTCDEMSAVFAEWNKGELDSFLIDITKDILAYKDEDGSPLVEQILDTAGQVRAVLLCSSIVHMKNTLVYLQTSK